MMDIRASDDWSYRIEQVTRSKHYTWLGEGLRGLPAEVAMVRLTADVMHICRHEGIAWDRIVHRGQQQFEREEHELLASSH